MELNSLKWVGSPCGLHGPYVFYKAFKFHLEGKPRILSLGDFFFVRCKPGDPICIAELQLLWEERTTKQLLSSSKLYFLPEDTPQGRTVSHGEDEVVAVSEKVIVKLDNLVKWTVSDVSQWRRGLEAPPLRPSVLRELGNNGRGESLHKFRESTLNSGLNFKDVLREKAELGDDEDRKRVLVLSYPQYCRYRSIIARLRERPSSLLTNQVVLALGGIASLDRSTQILYCRETFEHPTLIENKSICEEFAPNLKGRPRKKRPSLSQRRNSQGPAKNTSNPETSPPAKVKTDPKAGVTKPKSSSGCKKPSTDERTNGRRAEEEEEEEEDEEEGGGEEQAFLVALYKYMKERNTPIERIPYLGFKQINLWTMFQAALKLGGYELITARRQWKSVYDELGGNPGSTSAATCTRRHYERLILPYERFIKGEEDRPLPPTKPRRQEPGVQEGDGRPKAAAGKRLRVAQNHGAPVETDPFPRSPKRSPASDDKEESPEVVEQELGDPQTQNQLATEERKRGDEEEEERQLTVKKETLCGDVVEEEKPPPPPPALLGENGAPEPLARDLTHPLLQGYAITPTCPVPQGYPITPTCPVPLGYPVTPTHTLPEEDPGVTSKSFQHIHVQEQWRNGVPDYGVPRSVGKVDPSVTEETQNHVGLVLPTQKAPQAPAGAEALRDEESSCFSYKTGAHPGGNAGIMSPLAKKKLLSQVTSGVSTNNYSFAPPLSFIHVDHVTKELPGPLATGSEATVVNRPSVIQHAQRFKPRVTEDRKQEVASEPFVGDPAQCNPYLSRSDFPGKGAENQMPHLPQGPNFLSGFYSAHHLHSLYRQVEHCMSREQLARYLSRETPFPQDSGNGPCFTPNLHSDRTGSPYCPAPSDNERLSPGEMVSDDQPTDLSLPKPSPHKLTSSKPVPCGPARTLDHQDTNANPSPLLQTTSGLDYRPRACRVPPMTVSVPRKPLDATPLRATGKGRHGWGKDLLVPGPQGAVEEKARPVLSTNCSLQNVGAARPQRRTLEELENGPPEKRIRAVTPMHPVRDAWTPDPEAEGKPGEPTHTNGYAEGHKFPLHAPIFQGLYPGGLVSQVQDVCDSLGPHLPGGYANPLQYLKNQTVPSPLVPPFAIHSFMVQRQLLASTAAVSPHFYHHPARASSYREFLHRGLYPVSAFNPQPVFSPSQLSSVHPSTKL